MVYIVGKGRQVTVNVAKDGKVIKTFTIHQKRMHGDSVEYEGKDYPLLDGNLINLDGKGVVRVAEPPPKVPKVMGSRTFRDWDRTVAEKKEAKKGRGKK